MGAEAADLIFGKFLGSIGAVLVRYKKLAWDAHLRGESSRITPSETHQAVQVSIRGGPGWNHYSTWLKSDVQTSQLQYTFAWTGDVYAIKDVQTPYCMEITANEYKDGYVYGDSLVAPTLAIAIPSEYRIYTDDASLEVWVSYTAQTASEYDGVAGGYESSTPPESPVVLPFDLSLVESSSLTYGLKRKTASDIIGKGAVCVLINVPDKKLRR
ncbi:hypothetical protein H0H92_002323 [Tricholoma furcatifolium]|nr:hypothetical protein H0H92_002323 [Tricholoma furcatifolium]